MDKYANLTSQGTKAYINALDKIGWFDLPLKDRAKMTEHLEGISDSNYFFFSLSHIGVDAEDFEDGDAYKNFLHEVAKVSGIEVVSAEFEYDSLGFGEDEMSGIVVTKKATHNCELEEMTGWLDTDFIDHFINKEVLPAENINGRFFMLPCIDQIVQYTFISQDMYDKVIEAGILPDDPEYFM